MTDQEARRLVRTLRTAAWVLAAAVPPLLLTLLLRAVASGALDERDARMLDQLSEWGSAFDPVLIGDLVDLVDPRQASVLIAGTACAALLCGRRRRAIAAVLVLVVANATGLWLEPCCIRDLATPEGLLLSASAPSNHTVAAGSVGVAAVIAVPLALLGVAVTCAVLLAAVVGLGVVLLPTHAPSDVVAAYVLVLSCVVPAVLVSRPVPDRDSLLSPRARIVAALAVCIALLLLFGHRAPEEARRLLDAANDDRLAAAFFVGPAVALGVLVQVVALLGKRRSRRSARRVGATAADPTP